jgi:hypothetical protein
MLFDLLLNMGFESWPLLWIDTKTSRGHQGIRVSCGMKQHTDTRATPFGIMHRTDGK